MIQDTKTVKQGKSPRFKSQPTRNAHFSAFKCLSKLQGRTNKEEASLKRVKDRLEKYQLKGSMGLNQIYLDLVSKKTLAEDKVFIEKIPELSRIAHMLAHIAVAGTSRASHEAQFQLSGNQRNFFIVSRLFCVINSFDKASSTRKSTLNKAVLFYPPRVGANLLILYGICLPHYYEIIMKPRSKWCVWFVVNSTKICLIFVQ